MHCTTTVPSLQSKPHENHKNPPPFLFYLPTILYTTQQRKPNNNIINQRVRTNTKCYHPTPLNISSSFFSSCVLPHKQPVVEEISVWRCQVLVVHRSLKPPQGPPVLAMVQTGTTAGDGDPHQALGGATVPAQGVLQLALVEVSDMVLELALGLDPGMDMGLVGVELMAVALGLELVQAALVAVEGRATMGKSVNVLAIWHGASL